MTIGEKIQEVIDWSTLQQKDVCAATGISSSSLSSYIKGKNEISIKNLYKIADVLGVSPWIFLNGEPLPVTPQDMTEAEREHMRQYRMLTGGEQDAVDHTIREFNRKK